MYLMVGYKKGGYYIISESDFKTDQELGYAPKLGEPLQVQLAANGVGWKNASLIEKENRVDEKLSNADAEGSSNTSIYLVLALISSGVLAVLLRGNFAKAFQSVPRMVNPDAPETEEVTIAEPSRNASPTIFASDSEVTAINEIEAIEAPAANYVQRHIKVPPERYHLIENHLKQNAFQNFLRKQFDPLFFTLNSTEESKASATASRLKFPERLNVEFHDDTIVKSFVVHPFYREDTAEIDLSLSREDEAFDLSTPGSSYYVVGIGGPPDNPNEVYMIPSNKITHGLVKKDLLKPFRKSGVFFYDGSELV
jgi:hypothetical protein